MQVVLDENGMSKGYGFVHFETQESADMAIQKVNGMLLNEKKVYVGKFISRKERIREMGQNQRFTNVYVKNFGEDFTDELLMETFAAFGKIVSAKVMLDHNTGKGRGFGFVSFETPEAAAMVRVCLCVYTCRQNWRWLIVPSPFHLLPLLLPSHSLPPLPRL